MLVLKVKSYDPTPYVHQCGTIKNQEINVGEDVAKLEPDPFLSPHRETSWLPLSVPPLADPGRVLKGR